MLSKTFNVRDYKLKIHYIDISKPPAAVGHNLQLRGRGS